MYGEFSFFAVFSIILLFIIKEFYSLISISGHAKPQKLLGTVTALSLFCVTFLYSAGLCSSKFFVVLIPLVVLIFVVEIFSNRPGDAVDNIAFTLLGVVYIGGALSLLSVLAYPENRILLESGYSYKLILFIQILIWSNDTGAYLFGVKFGKHKMSPKISPKKSWEGTIGGVFVTALVAFLLTNTMLDLPWYHTLGLSILTSISAVVGDLIESSFKRIFQIKDSGNTLPGHGGFLDRFDSFILAIPMAAFYIIIFS